ncbi:HK97 gp10 family phage protein [Variovorax boronicumulans]|uniref:HK97 gp10 family phage protein n=1 Tax=Variovorax boronicumulans TaxID=436515 RepID=UPI00197E625C|nr:HK97 gp10 family phage protein [Variovorax boronicumulans]
MADFDQLDLDARELVRPAAQAGAQVYYVEVLHRVPVAATGHKRKGGRVIPPGQLKKSIYQAYSADHSNDRQATYHISWNARKAPHGHLIENGHWTKSQGKHGPLKPKWVPAHPFIRSSFDAVSGSAQQAAVAVLDDGLARALEKLG